MEFTLSRDKFSIIITTLLISFSLAGIAVFQFSEMNMGYRSHYIFGLSSILLLIVCLALFVFRPQSYKIEKGNIIIKRMFQDKMISANEIKIVRIPTDKEIAWPIRTFGNGGIFGYTGRYYTKHLGKMLWFCSRRSNLVFIERKGKISVVISPDLPKEFVSTYQVGI